MPAFHLNTDRRVEIGELPSEMRIESRGFVVEITDSERFFTVYRMSDDRVMGTIVRPRRNESGWTASFRDGTLIVHSAIGPRNAMIRLTQWLAAEGH